MTVNVGCGILLINQTESRMEPIEMTVLRIVCSALFIWGAVELFIKLVNGPKKKQMATKNKVKNGSET